MRLLVDSHALIWYVDQDHLLSPASHALIWYVDQDHLLSPASHAALTNPSNDLLLSAGSIINSASTPASRLTWRSRPL
jgi:PIN domain nuclease of toxin-antitoxin system